MMSMGFFLNLKKKNKLILDKNKQFFYLEVTSLFKMTYCGTCTVNSIKGAGPLSKKHNV